ncbi:MAG: D-glycero-beta-D-manno-heptose 1-phosphate adenylyltransferase [Bacteroidetes bacterium]|nr:D-glycero-beta-D-manno-heptose 1-phosphate adenylyltransferase [Bacteroidota bacterium]HET6245409.1 D-glycero-beta-D-manno-heptose 1-phosphate adenylyltransferase [Bacteroidia bacterium]
MKKEAILRSKIFQREQLLKQINAWRFLNRTIVFTNGCFDILHKGHIDYLMKAADLGTKLVVGINTDDSVKRLQKGKNRPIQDEESRAMIMASLFFVDAVVLFDEDTPYELIKTLQPDVLVKGGDYTIETLVGSDIVKAHGGETIILDLLEGFSTSLIEKKILG